MTFIFIPQYIRIGHLLKYPIMSFIFQYLFPSIIILYTIWCSLVSCVFDISYKMKHCFKHVKHSLPYQRKAYDIQRI